jgi:transposase
VSTLDHTLKPQDLHRLEVITGTGRRRRFSDDDKARIIEETLVPGAVVSEIARRHGLSPQQLFGWRRQARQPASASTETSGPLFVPALVEATLPERAVRRCGRNRPLDADRVAGMIEVEIGSVTVRVGRGADVTAVIRALKASA